MRFNTRVIGSLLCLVMVCCGASTIRAQRGAYLTLDGGMAFGDLEHYPSLRFCGDVKWMFLPYLGASFGVTLQHPGINPNVAPLSASMVGLTDKVSSTTFTSDHLIIEITSAYCLNLVFQPIAIANRETPHIFSIAFGGGVGLGYSQQWKFPSMHRLGMPIMVDYNYGTLFDFIATVNFSYAYQVYGPLYIGVHAGCMAQVQFSFFDVYGGATLALRFSKNLNKATKAD